MTRTRHALAALVPLLVVLAACGDDDDDATTTTEAEAPGTTEADDTTTTGADDDEGDAEADAALVAAAASDLGQILVSDGMTLYLFTPDDAGASTCYDDCAATWPPLLADGDVTVGEGLDQAAFDTVARDDGGEQVTVNGWPLYFFANDAAPGDTNGQGLGGNWWVVSPDGEAIEAT